MIEARTVGENRALNLVRSVAALLVVLGHVRLLFFEDQSSRSIPMGLFYLVTGVGTPAVIVFFVLSGYWVGGQAIRSLERGRFSWRGYASARLTRLWIVLIPALLLTFVLDTTGRAIAPSADIHARTSLYDGVPPSFDHSVPSLLGTIGFVGDLHVQVFGSDQPLWSLAYEFWYYLLFPAALLAFGFARTGRGRIAAALVLLLSLLVAGLPVLQLFPAWLAGAAVGWQRDRIVALLRRAPRAVVPASQLLLTAAVLAMVAVTRQGPLNSIGGKLVLGALTAVWIAVLVDDVRWPGKADRVLGAIAQSAHWSYSLYAIHMPIVVIAAALLVPRRVDRWSLGIGTAAAFLALVVGLQVAAALFASVTEGRTDQVRRLLAGGLRRSDRPESSPEGGRALH